MTTKVPKPAPDERRPPAFERPSFECPRCSAFAQQDWSALFIEVEDLGAEPVDGHHVSKCLSCGMVALWINEKLVYPVKSAAPPPSEDMPQAARDLYVEAASIAPLSPRGAAALLRVATEKLVNDVCDMLPGKPSKRFNDKIGFLVENGLPEVVQKALDSTRYFGNEAAHPGEIRFDDDPEIVQDLFKMMAIITSLLTQKKRVENLWSRLPDDVRDGVARRDGDMADDPL